MKSRRAAGAWLKIPILRDKNVEGKNRGGGGDRERDNIFESAGRPDSYKYRRGAGYHTSSVRVRKRLT